MPSSLDIRIFNGDAGDASTVVEVAPPDAAASSEFVASSLEHAEPTNAATNTSATATRRLEPMRTMTDPPCSPYCLNIVRLVPTQGLPPVTYCFDMGTDEIMAGYWMSPWPAEDGGPTRRQTPGPQWAGSLTASYGGATPLVTARQSLGNNMVVLGDPGEVFVQGSSLGGPDSTAWVERIDPISLEAVVRSVDLPGGQFWPGGMALHANGALYVTHGRWCHRLNRATLEVEAARQLPRHRPYNSLLVLPDGHLVMKDFCGGDGVHAITNDDGGSQLVVLEPDNLTVVSTCDLPEGSIARLSAQSDITHGTTVVVVGDTSLFEVPWFPATTTLGAPSIAHTYRTVAGQTFGWDAVIASGSAWLLDNGEGTNQFGPSFAGRTSSTSPLHLIRIALGAGGPAPCLVEVCGLPGGIVANPPLVDDQRRIVIAYDSGHGVMTGFAYTDDPAAPPIELWRRNQHHAGHMILDQTAGLALTCDYDHDRGVDQAVGIDVASGTEVWRTDTDSPLQSVIFPAPGWDDDIYITTFSTLTRLRLG